MKDYYSQLDKALKEYENHTPHKTYSTEWISSRIVWCWKFRKVTPQQANELMDRMINVFDSGGASI